MFVTSLEPHQCSCRQRDLHFTSSCSKILFYAHLNHLGNSQAEEATFAQLHLVKLIIEDVVTIQQIISMVFDPGMAARDHFLHSHTQAQPRQLTAWEQASPILILSAWFTRLGTSGYSGAGKHKSWGVRIGQSDSMPRWACICCISFHLIPCIS